MSADDRQFAARLARGDAQAFAGFVDTYGPRLLRLARKYAATEADAEDLTQDIFVAIARSVGGYRGESRLSTWVYRVALNQCLKCRERQAPAGLAYDDALRDAAAPASDGPARTALRRELAAEVDRALDALGPGHRDVVILHELHGLTYGECAETLQIPVGTVKSRLSHAFRRLRVSLGAYVLAEG